MVSIFKCQKAAIYHNTSKLTLTQIKAKTGCTHIINGYLFNTKFKPCGWLVIDSEIISKDKYNDWGFSCGNFGAPTMSTDRSKNFIGGIPILKGGNRVYRGLTPDVARPAERTAVAWLPNGRIILWCDNQQLTRDELQSKLLALGAVDALMLDGGGSTQGIFPDDVLKSSRKVATVILFWDDTVDLESEKTTREVKCPYAEPTMTIQKGSAGIGSKWVQWQLNRHGSSLIVDGNFGIRSVSELILFQRKNGLVADGICGPATRAALKL